MKLDKIKFAQLIAYIGDITNRGVVDSTDVQVIDDIIDIETPVQPQQISVEALNSLMKAIHKGEKIEAIKHYRMLTNAGLKEAKDAVEKDWTFKYTKQEIYSKFNATKLSQEEDNIIAKFISAAF